MRYLLTLASAVMILVVSAVIDSGSVVGVLDSRIASSECQQGWTVVTSPNPGDSSNLSDVAAVSSNDVWAVGSFRTEPEQHALALHWDGVAWSIVPIPNLPSPSSLNGIDAISSNDVWAVGQTIVSETVPLITHWDGTAWSVVPSPIPGSFGELQSVAAVSSNDVWAVGYSFTSNSERGSLTMHWDGTAWSVAPNPNLGSSVGFLNGVTAVSSNDVWAVGNLRSAADEVSPLVMHWDGTDWSVVPRPNPPGNNDLSGVAAASSSDVWAVGTTDPGATALILHWDETAWAVEPTPSGTGFGIDGVSVFSADDVWGAGSFATWHWDGTTWSVVGSVMYGVAVTTVANAQDRDVWLVGYTQHDQVSDTLTARFCGTVLTETPSATPAPSATTAPSPTPARLPASGGPLDSHSGNGLELLGAIMSLIAVVSILTGWSRMRRGARPDSP